MSAPAPWLWPDRVIGKREARRLREEHNAAINLLDEACTLLADVIENGAAPNERARVAAADILRRSGVASS